MKDVADYIFDCTGKEITFPELVKLSIEPISFFPTMDDKTGLYHNLSNVIDPIIEASVGGGNMSSSVDKLISDHVTIYLNYHVRGFMKPDEMTTELLSHLGIDRIDTNYIEAMMEDPLHHFKFESKVVAFYYDFKPWIESVVNKRVYQNNPTKLIIESVKRFFNSIPLTETRQSFLDDLKNLKQVLRSHPYSLVKTDSMFYQFVNDLLGERNMKKRIDRRALMFLHPSLIDYVICITVNKQITFNGLIDESTRLIERIEEMEGNLNEFYNR